MKVQHFLLIFDHKQARLLDVAEFGSNSELASLKYREAELSYQDERDIDIVLVGSDSLETVKLTHANYFNGTASVSKYLAGLLP